MFKKLFQKLFTKNQTKSEIQPETIEFDLVPESIKCPFCGWTGNSKESLTENQSNDTCPICGETSLEYIIEG